MSAGAVAPRVSENLNRALHTLFGRENRLFLLGEDLADPYGGAFKISKGLSTRFPDRVVSTPLSEGGILGVGGGLALCGNKVIVEFMFADFVALGFDQLLNFASKSVSMYGSTVEIPLVVRCPVGGNRGYGPTHSQSLQKHFVGIPNLALFELSPFHDAETLLEAMLSRGAPCVLFEDKVLYTRRMFQDNRVDDDFRYRITGSRPGWAHIHPQGSEAHADAVIIAPGGVSHRAIGAARALRGEHGRAVHVLTPAQLYPLDLEPVLPLLSSAGQIAVVEEGTAGGTWGTEVAQALYGRIWSSLRTPVLVLSSADSIIPTAGHLEREVLLGADDIQAAIRSAAGWQGGAEEPGAVVSPVAEARQGTPFTVPKLNNNDTEYLVVEWLVADGERVEPGTEVISLETSKAVEDVPVGDGGYLRHVAAVGEERAAGDVLGYLFAERDSEVLPQPAQPVVQEPAREEERPAESYRLSRAQQGTSAVVARSHREIPAAFTVVKAEVDTVLDALARLSDESGAAMGLAEVVIKAVAGAYEKFPMFFAALADEQTVALADAPHVGVTVDVDGSLYVPVVRRAHEQSVVDISDALMEFRMKAVGREFTESDLSGGNISVSLNPDPGVVLVNPIVLWPQLCMVSLGAVGSECRIDRGAVTERRIVHIGLAYDHRVINGRDAVEFLTAIRTSIEDPGWLG